MSAAYEELVELLDERGIGYWTNGDQAVRLDLRGEGTIQTLRQWRVRDAFTGNEVDFESGSP
jgi:hypothetical protein